MKPDPQRGWAIIRMLRDRLLQRQGRLAERARGAGAPIGTGGDDLVEQAIEDVRGIRTQNTSLGAVAPKTTASRAPCRRRP
jgi:hypothetical protein